jgi:pre-peptidase
LNDIFVLKRTLNNMKKSFLSTAYLALLISATFSLSSCEKVSELDDDIDELIDQTLGIKALTEDLSKTSSNFNNIEGLTLAGRDASSEIKVNVSSGVPFGYVHKRYTLSGSVWSIKTTSYSGTIGKSYFTNKSTANIVKVSVQNNVPNLTVNGTLVSSGSGSGGGGTSTTPPPPSSQILVDKVLEGEKYAKQTLSFTLPSGVKTMEIRTSESSSAYYNAADMFVRRGSAPVVNGPKPPNNTPAYTWTADCHGIKPNREQEVCTFNNPTSGTWYVTLYGYNTYYSSRVTVTITK